MVSWSFFLEICLVFQKSIKFITIAVLCYFSPSKSISVLTDEDSILPVSKLFLLLQKYVQPVQDVPGKHNINSIIYVILVHMLVNFNPPLFFSHSTTFHADSLSSVKNSLMNSNRVKIVELFVMISNDVFVDITRNASLIVFQSGNRISKKIDNTVEPPNNGNS